VGTDWREGKPKSEVEFDPPTRHLAHCLVCGTSLTLRRPGVLLASGLWRHLDCEIDPWKTDPNKPAA
jgi:hypothetical protein